MKKIILCILIFSLLFAGCGKVIKLEKQNPVAPDPISSEKPMILSSKDMIGSIKNPYISDGSAKVNLTCQIMNKGSKSEINIEVSNIYCVNEYSISDWWYFGCNIKLMNYKGNIPINVQDYLTVVYYDKHNNIVGQSEYPLRNSDSEEDEGLIFRKVSWGFLDSGSVYNSNRYEEFDNKELDKLALKYYDGKKYKKVFFKIPPCHGSKLNPYKGTDQINLKCYLPDSKEDDYYIDIGISDVTLSKVSNGYVTGLDLKLYDYSDRIETVDGIRYINDKTINSSDYLSVVYYYDDHRTNTPEYRLCNTEDSNSKMKAGDTIRLSTKNTDSKARKDRPSLVAIKYYYSNQYRRVYVKVKEKVKEADLG